jgi:hypothetical protein
VAGDERLLREVLRQRRLADPVGADEDDVASLAHEVQAQELVDELVVDLRRPGPVEVRRRLEAAEARVAHATLEAAARPLGLFEREEALEPRLAPHLVPARHEAVQAELARPPAQRLGVGRRPGKGHGSPLPSAS